jgi:hypothetical protein
MWQHPLMATTSSPPAVGSSSTTTSPSVRNFSIHGLLCPDQLAAAAAVDVHHEPSGRGVENGASPPLQNGDKKRGYFLLLPKILCKKTLKTSYFWWKQQKPFQKAPNFENTIQNPLILHHNKKIECLLFPFLSTTVISTLLPSSCL